ncbi:MAG: YabP/YqfC family sporulation protein [Desulfitobacteriaceae bacterium]
MFDKLQKSVGNVLELPPDVMGDGPKISINGRHQLAVENFHSVLTFSEDEIRLQTSEGELCFTGKGFVLKTILSTEIRIEGELSSLTFGGGQE